ncbi:MAG: hypothetical protein SNF93_02960 [Rikenellaceae bacterium]
MPIVKYILPLILLCAVSCGSSGQLPVVKDVDPAGWFAPTPISFDVNSLDRSVQMRVLLRTDSTFDADSVQLMISTVAPNGVMWSEHFTINMPQGSGSMGVAESLYRDNIRWSQTGEYRVILQPQHTYQGITAVGVSIIEK